MAFSAARFSRFQFSGDAVALVAGDSNVLRMTFHEDDDCDVKCLPISGAKYVRDKKNFRQSLKFEMKKRSYDAVYLHLGSNDVLCKEEVFYSNVAEMCDMIHETSPTTEIVLCEVLPRDQDCRRGRGLPAEQLRECQQWIVMANQLLMEYTLRIPYVRFFSYGRRSMLFNFLSKDGLHLHVDGAKQCFDAICEDVLGCYFDEENGVDETIVEDWPAIVEETVQSTVEVESDTVPTISYASVLKKSPPSVMNTTTSTKKNSGPRRMTRRKHRPRVSRRNHISRKSSYRRTKTYSNKAPSRMTCNVEDMLQLNMSTEVSVLVRPSLLQPKMFKFNDSAKKHVIRIASHPFVTEQKRKAKISWYFCPQCTVKCSQEDFLFDHIIKKHCSKSEKPTIHQQSDQTTTLNPEVAECKLDIEQEDSTEKQVASCEGVFYVFPPTFWKKLHQLMIIGHLCGSHGLHKIMSLLVQQNINLTRLRLLLSNDVEQNPGPVFNCEWEGCGYILSNLHQYESHLINHAAMEEKCRWIGCNDTLDANNIHFILALHNHVAQHLFNTPGLFPTIEDWYSVEGNLSKDLNLHRCPKSLRSKLNLMLFDEDFEIPTQMNYTILSHLFHLYSLITADNASYINLQRDFLLKRQQRGETQPLLNIEDLCRVSKCAKPKIKQSPNFTIQNNNEYDFVSTSRPELCSNFHTGVVLKSKSCKRKQLSELNLPILETDWSRNLLKNLGLCSDAIVLHKSILQAILDQSVSTSKAQSFIKIEQEAAKVSAIQKCTRGVFFCTVFKCRILEKEIYYIRYFESGSFSGFMHQQYLDTLRAELGFSDDNVFLNCTFTSEDISNMNIKNRKNIKRERPDKTFTYSVDKIFPSLVDELNTTPSTDDIQLHSFILQVLPYKNKMSLDCNERKIAINSMQNQDISQKISEFFLEKRTNISTLASSKDFLTERSSDNLTLLEQCEILNCLSADIKQRPELFNRTARFESNFMSNTFDATSLRIRTMHLYLKNDIQQLIVFFLKYFPELDVTKQQLPQSDVVITPMIKKRKINPVKTVSISKNVLQNQLKIKYNCAMSQNPDPVNLFDNYCCSLLDHGKLLIQSYDESGYLVTCMNDYSDTDGSFKYSDFVYTTRLRQEAKDYFYCTCSIYKTLLDLEEQKKHSDEQVMLDINSDDSVTCMHCKFLKSKVIPCLADNNTESHTVTRIGQFIQNALQYNGKTVVELSTNKDTHKYSVLAEGDDRPSFVHLSFSKRINKFIVSCLNGTCKAKRGYKKTVNTLQNALVCKHLNTLKDQREFLHGVVNDSDPVIEPESESLLTDETATGVELTSNSDLTDMAGINFNEETGLWIFNCKSDHSPKARNSPQLQKNVITRDIWNDNNFQRLSDGCLKGPVLFPDVPEYTCPCGSGWLKREDETDYTKDGITAADNRRTLTIYTTTAPVKCDIFKRLCYNINKPCELYWNEGESECVHVLSRDTAAGDEIGWDFVSLVIRSGLTFSSYCQWKTDNYRLRDENAKFMDSKVFIKWWFSWAANMKLDFRIPCDICGFEPKRLCCDGTRVGVGFRHANFEEINTFDLTAPTQNTLHRRMDRCFLRNMKGINKQQMISNRQTLNYLARSEIGELKTDEILSQEQLDLQISNVKLVLPDEVVPSFDRFFIMSESEKLAYSYVLKMLATTASITSLIPKQYCSNLQRIISNPNVDVDTFNLVMNEMRMYAPEIKDLIVESKICNNDMLPDDIRLFIQYLINESLALEENAPDVAIPQAGTYNPPKFGRAYYFNKLGLKLRNTRKFSIDNDSTVRKNIDHDDNALDFERCQKLYSKVQTSAPGTSNLFLWFCADHGHCYGFHMTGAEGRKDPAASLYSYLEQPPKDVFYDFACNLQEYCLNRESGFYSNVRFFHDIFHSYAHKCSCAFKSSRLQGFETVNSEICEQFNSFIQCLKKSARQMSQTHFCFYLQFFLHQWNERKKLVYRSKIRVALAGL